MLYFVPTPIGNMEDVTLRAMRLFREVKYFFCEDTRTTMKLLGLLEIDYKDKEFYALTSFTGQGKINHYLNILRESDAIVVSEAGTPGLSDPGKMMIQECNTHGLLYCVLPGANALVPAVVSAGFDTSKFMYLGFLPQKKGRMTALQEIAIPSARNDFPVFFYESVHRIEKTMLQLKELGFVGKVCLCRELSKLHEQIVNANLDEVIEMIKSGKIVQKGEFVVGCRREK